MSKPTKLSALALTALFAVAACGDAPTGVQQSVDETFTPPGPSFDAVTITNSFVFPIVEVNFVPCANGGSGEVVLVEGNVHAVIHFTIPDAGGIIGITHFNLQGVTGTGLTTGGTYPAVGVARQTETFAPGGLPATFTFANNFHLIGPGPNNNLLVHQTFHTTIDANGNVTATLFNTSIECM